MSDNKEQNQQRDYFSQYIQQQLKAHQVLPDESCWDEIGLRMRRRRIRLLLTRGLYIAGAAVAALLVLVSIPTNEANAPSFYSEVIENPAVSDKDTELPIDDQIITTTDVKPVLQSPIVRVFEEVNFEKVMEIVPVNRPETVSDRETDTEKGNENDKPTVNEKKKKTELPVLPDRQISLINKNRQKRNWQVGAGLVAMGNNSLGIGESQKHYDMQNSNDASSWIPSVPNYDNHLNPEDCDDISYNLPLSFGITVRKELGKKLSVETGLVYTYLSTNFRKDGLSPIKAKLGLHYLGVPVNLIVDLWDNPKWNVYASGGVMVEKGLRSVYKEHFYRTNSEEEVTVKTSIHGIQWSLNGSVGVSYRLLKDWSLYAEPRLSYFFDNNQPVSVRTDKPLTLGFGLGVRFDF